MRASDGDQTTDATVTVDVTDVAEAPSFAQAGYTFALAENADGSVARLSLGTVSATDPDGGSVSYGIEGGNESGRFEIGAASGELFYVGGGEDYETGSTSFELTVRASDGDRTTDTAVTVNVTDVDEPVAVDPPVAQEVQSVPQTVSEGATDLPNDNSTPGRVAVGGSATGTIGRARDNDRFAVELEAGRTYQFDLEGSPGGGGTLPDTYFRAIYNSDGRYQSGSYNDNFDGSRDSRVTFTPTASGTHYARVSGDRDEVGSYTLRVTDMTAPETGGSSTNPVPPEPQEPTVDFVGPDETVPQESTSEPDDQGQAVPPQPDTSQAQGEPASVSEGDTDLPADSTTTGRVAVGGWVRGDIDVSYDKDWFAVDLKADTEYEIVMAGGSWIDRIYHGSLVSPQIHGVYTADATKIVGGGSRQGNPKSVLVTPEEDGTYYVQTGGWVNRVGAYTLSVTDLSVEPTDDYADDIDTEGTVAVGGSAGSATGNIEVGSDIDWFAVTLEADKIYRFDLEGSPTGDGSLPDPVLRGIYDADGERLPGTGNNNYIAGEGRNSAVYFTPDDSGTYYVAAAAGSIASGWDKHPGTYTLTVTDFDESGDDYVAVPNSAKTGTVMVGGSAATGDIETAGDYDWFAVALDAGKFYRVDMRGVTLQDTFLSGVYDDDGDRIRTPFCEDIGVGDSRLIFNVPESGTYYVVAKGGSDISDAQAYTGTYTLSVTEATDTDDYAADPATTGTVAVGGSVEGSIDLPGDQDWFAVELEAGKTYRFDLEGSRTSDVKLSDPYLRGIHDAGGERIANTTDDDSGEGRNSRVYFTPNEDATYDATYYVAAGAYRDCTSTYTLYVEEVDGM